MKFGFSFFGCCKVSIPDPATPAKPQFQYTLHHEFACHDSLTYQSVIQEREDRELDAIVMILLHINVLLERERIESLMHVRWTITKKNQ
jgi:hypothetical protein